MLCFDSEDGYRVTYIFEVQSNFFMVCATGESQCMHRIETD